MFNEIKRIRLPEAFLIDIIKGMKSKQQKEFSSHSIFYEFNGEIVFELSKSDLYVNQEIIWEKLYQHFNSNTRIVKLILKTFNDYSNKKCDKVFRANTYRLQTVKKNKNE